MRSAIVSATVWLAVSVGAFSAEIRVPLDQPTIQAAIDAAVNGDTVIVYPNTYFENIDFRGKAITVRNFEYYGPADTIIDGSNQGSVVTFTSNEGPDSILEGFTLQNGSGAVTSLHGWIGGGGVFCEYASPTIRNNIITGNDNAPHNDIEIGAGVWCYESDALIQSNLVTLNRAGRGAGMAWYGGSPSVINNTISSNTASNSTSGWDGGGIYCDTTTALVEGNLIVDNWASYGGGIFCHGYDSTIANNIIAGNEAGFADGGGVFCTYSENIRFTNNTIYGNTAHRWGGGLYFTYFSSGTVKNTTFWNNTAEFGPEITIHSFGYPSTLTISHSDVQGGKAAVHVDYNCTLNWGNGMIDSDPQVIDAGEHDYHIQYGSPCRNAGTNSAPGIPATDVDGNPRITEGQVDIGADEFHTHLYAMGELTPGGDIEVKCIGYPSATEVGLFYSLSKLDPPTPTAWGDWYLGAPYSGPILLGPLPPSGVHVLSTTIPMSPTWPYSIYTQALVRYPAADELTPLATLDVR